MTKPQEVTYHQYSRHVSSALSPDKLDFYRCYPQYVARRFPTINPSWFVDISSGKHNNITIFTWIEDHIKKYEPTIDIDFSSSWELVWQTTITSLELQIESLTSGLSNAEYNQMLTTLHHMKGADLLYAGKTKAFIINIHNSIERHAEQGDKNFRMDLLPEVEFVGDLIVLHGFPGGAIVITYQMLVNCFDKLEAKFSWLFYVKYMSLQSAHKTFEVDKLFFAIYSILEDAYKTLGNEAVRVCKLLEPLLIGVSLQELDPRTHDHDFGNIIRSTYEEEKSYLQPYVNKIWLTSKQFLAKFGSQGIPYLIEQYGQEKLHNYPIVSIESGLEKMHQYGTSIRISEDQAVRDIASNFKREYFVAYYEKHKVLPKVVDNWRLDSRIKTLILKGKPGSIRECYKIPNEA